MKWVTGRLFCIVLLLCALLSFAAAEGAETTKDYIICYRSAMRGRATQRPIVASLTESELQALLRDGVVEWYEEDSIVTLMDAASEDYSDRKWDLAAINVTPAHRNGFKGQGVRVAVIDSGVNPHDDLADNLHEGYNYLDQTTDVTDNIGHGTFVSGLIAAVENGVGIDGVAPQATIVPLKCFDTGAQTKTSQICMAIYDAVEIYHCDVINMSFGLQENPKALKMAVDDAASHGVLMVASTGNDGAATLYYPAAYDCVIGVGAVNKNGTVASFSQRNESVFVSAPGAAIWSISAADGYESRSGTSFAAPLVSGMLAVLKSVDPQLATERAKEILSQSADDCGDEGYDILYGYGTINVARAVSLLCGEELHLRGDVNSDGEVTVKDVTLLQRWLVGGYDVTIDSALADVNGDGEVNGKDVTHLRRRLVGGYGVVPAAAS